VARTSRESSELARRDRPVFLPSVAHDVLRLQPCEEEFLCASHPVRDRRARDKLVRSRLQHASCASLLRLSLLLAAIVGVVDLVSRRSCKIKAQGAAASKSPIKQIVIYHESLIRPLLLHGGEGRVRNRMRNGLESLGKPETIRHLSPFPLEKGEAKNLVERAFPNSSPAFGLDRGRNRRQRFRLELLDC